jgi:hypothetical protein
MAEIETKFKSCGWNPVEWSKDQNRKKCGLFVFCGEERILTAGAVRVPRFDEVLMKEWSRRGGSQVEMWWRSSMKATMRESDEGGGVVIVS